ncbi:MAG: trigger factor [Clostridia bacterium]
MEHTVEKLSGNKVKISFKAPAAAFDEALEKAYLKTRGHINVPGFRKGKAPRRLIESMYGSAVFYDDALEMLFPDAYTAAVEENKLLPVGRPELDVQEMEKGKDLAFSCEVYVYPDVTLGEYMGVAVTRKLRKIADSEVNSRIEQEQKRVARSVDITERPLQNGDKANLDYSGTVDGVKFDGGTAEGQTLQIGSNSFIPGFEEQMVGMQLGEERDLNVQFPDEYHAEELKGKPAVFHVKLNGITCEELPELDDDFAAEVSDFDTFAEYRADVETQLQAAAVAQADDTAKQSMLDTIIAASTVEVPAPMVEDKLDEMMQQMGWRMEQQGFSMEQYLKMLGQTAAPLRERHPREADNNPQPALVTDAIIKAEGIAADEAEVDKLLESYATSMNDSLAHLKASFSAGQLDYFNHRACVTKAFDLLWQAAKVTDAEITDPAPEQSEEKADEESAKA